MPNLLLPNLRVWVGVVVAATECGLVVSFLSNSYPANTAAVEG